MAIRKLPDGTWEFDTIAEAAGFATQSEQSVSPRAKRPRRSAPENNGEQGRSRRDIVGFVGDLTEQGRAVVAVLASADSEVNTDDMAHRTKIAAARLPPVMKHIRTQAKNHGLGWDEFLKAQKIVVNGKPRRAYSVDPRAKKVLLDALSS